MSIEVAIQELTQAVLLNTRSLDLLMAQIAEVNGSPEKVLTTGTKEKSEVKAGVTEDEVKASKEYKKLIKIMGDFNKAAMARNGGDKDAAREQTVGIISQYTEDGKAATLVQGLLEGEVAQEVYTELVAHYENGLVELESSAETTNMEEAAKTEEGSDDDFGDEEGEEAVTAEDVKAALRQYAAVEGKPAAIAMLKNTTGSASVAGVDPKDYAKAIKALEV